MNKRPTEVTFTRDPENAGNLISSITGKSSYVCEPFRDLLTGRTVTARNSVDSFEWISLHKYSDGDDYDIVYYEAYSRELIISSVMASTLINMGVKPGNRTLIFKPERKNNNG